MTAVRQLGRVAAGLLAIAVGTFLILHVSIVAAYGGGGSGEVVAALVLGMAIVLVLIAMWSFGRPASLWARTAVCVGLATGYFAFFIVVV